MTPPTREPLSDQMRAHPQRFDFFHAVRLLERAAREQGAPAAEIGVDTPPGQEAVRFRSAPSLSFPTSTLAAIAPVPAGAGARRWELLVTFMGLTGPGGALPHHYTSTIIEQERAKRPAMREFLDLFAHRLISLFYRAWQKYRLPIAYERSRVRPAPASANGHADAVAAEPWAGRDPFTSVLLSLVGLGGRSHQGRLTAGEEVFLLYAGHFARRPRGAASLGEILADFFGVAARVCQFRGRWLPLERADRSRLGARGAGDGGYCALGRTLVLGGRVWDVQSAFRVRLGPLGYSDFCRFVPGSDGLNHLAELTRMYAGAELDFDVQPVLRAAEVPRSRLGRAAGGGRLGRNLWLTTVPPAADFDRRAFELGSAPQRVA